MSDAPAVSLRPLLFLAGNVGNNGNSFEKANVLALPKGLFLW
jgi:hypothetical protein